MRCLNRAILSPALMGLIHLYYCVSCVQPSPARLLVVGGSVTTEAWLKAELSRLGLQHFSHHFCHPSAPLALRRLLPSLITPKPGATSATVEELQQLTPRNDSSSAWQAGGVLGEADVCRGRNLVTRVQSQRGRGDESVVLVTPLTGPWIQSAGQGGASLAPGAEDAVGLTFGISLLQLFLEAKWLARDVIWVVADSACGADVAVHHWLHDYYSGQASSCSQRSSQAPETPPPPPSTPPQSAKQPGTAEGESGGFIRGGMLLGAVVFHVEPEGWDWGQGDLGRAIIRANGLNGHMPNMDLPAVAAKLADWMYFPARLGASAAEGPGMPQGGPKWDVVGVVADLLDWVKGVAATLGVQTKELASGEQYRQRAPQLLEQIVWQVLLLRLNLELCSLPFPPLCAEAAPAADCSSSLLGLPVCIVHQCFLCMFSAPLQLQGTSPGAHGPFREFQVDAMSISVEATNRAFWAGQNQRQRQQQQQGVRQPVGQKEGLAASRTRAYSSHRLLQANEVPFSNSMVLWGRLLESVVRCLSNLSERLHHSHFFYLLCSLDSFLPITHYLAPFALLLLPLALAASRGCAGCSHCLKASGLVATVHPGILWLACGMLVLSFFTWGCVVTLLPALIIFLQSSIQPLAPTAALGLGTPWVALTLWGTVSLTSLVGLAATWRAITRPYFLAAAAALCPSPTPSPNPDPDAQPEASEQTGLVEGTEKGTGERQQGAVEKLSRMQPPQLVEEGVRELERLACLSLAIGCSAVGLAAACAVNFAVAVAGGLVLAPLYLLALPWTRVDLTKRGLRRRQQVFVALRVLAFLCAMIGMAYWALVISGAPLYVGKLWFWVIWAIVEMHVGYLVGMLVVLPSIVCCLYVNFMH